MNSNKKVDIPFHHFSETYKDVNIRDGHPALSIDPSFPFVITQFDLMSHKAQAEIPHRHDYFEIIFIEEGSGKHIIDYEPYEIKTPAFYFLTKGQIHFWKLEKKLEGKVLLFPREFLIPPATAFNNEGDLAIFNSLSKAPCVIVNEENISKINELFKGLNEEYLRKSTSSLSMLRAYGHILLVNLF